ncbi:MAG: hypothetical protein JWL96_4271 [Sphingomonas bacterium]|uniref:PqqD family protein n=1 Tax=Sphingomonas bacterium TaxID=1895847 RepID=UPI0026250BED|nr:PqqD family protein [Sphingomonas bacterium]MDB5712201.1 hypothetical protein [Sphingomonas bacterium]
MKFLGPNGADALIRHRPGLIAAESGGEMVVLDPDRGEFIELSTSAARIWSLLDNAITVSALCQRMSEQFEIDPSACRIDVETFVAALAERGLIEIV